MQSLNESQRRLVLDKALKVVDGKFVDPNQKTPDLAKLRDKHESEIVNAYSSEDFEKAVNAMLQKLGASHTGVFHESQPRAAGRIAIAATFTKAETRDGTRWIFQDVHPGGAAAQAGIRPGDILLTVAEKELVPPEPAVFALGRDYS